MATTTLLAAYSNSSAVIQEWNGEQLLQLQERSVKETAQILGISSSAVKARRITREPLCIECVHSSV